MSVAKGAWQLSLCMQVVQYLLANNYLLTALELLVEAQEAGNEDDVESLQRFFSDQAKFPAEVVATYNPKDGMYHCVLLCPDHHSYAKVEH